MPATLSNLAGSSATGDHCGLAADFVALTSHEIVSAEGCAGKFLVFDGAREAMLDDDCLVARHVVPFESYPWHVWHHIASDILGEPYDLQDASQIDRLLQQRGLFPRDATSSPQWIALYQTDLSTLLEGQQHHDPETQLLAELRMDVLDSTTPPEEPDYYIDAREIVPEQWEAVSILIFDQPFADAEGRPFDLIFHRPDLTTGDPACRAFAALRELQNALSEYAPNPDARATFDLYTSRLAQAVAASPASTAFLFDRSTEEFSRLAAFVEERHPGWRDSVPILPAIGDLRPVPPGWNGRIEIVGLRDAPYARMRVDHPEQLTTAYGVYAERSDASLVWLGTASDLAEATRLKGELEVLSMPFRQSASSV